ncbi:hypothetical protein [Streptomyces sp. NPDC056670]|uniref:hypothetical protein n=2 Tax=unclassified Streptomyces TaxID=2593676 RepID=UPI0036A1AED7
MSTSDQEQVAGAAPETRGGSRTAKATVPSQDPNRPTGSGPSGKRDAEVSGSPRAAEAAGADGRARAVEGSATGEAAEAGEAVRAVDGLDGAEPRAAAEATASAADAGPAAPVDAVAPAEPAPAAPAASAAAPDAPGAANPAAAQHPLETGEFGHADDEAEGSPEEGDEPRAGMAPWMARRVRMIAAGVLMAAMGVILVVRLATRSSVLVVGVYGLALILCGVVIELSRNGRTRLGSWLLVVGLAAAFGMDWFVLP